MLSPVAAKKEKDISELAFERLLSSENEMRGFVKNTFCLNVSDRGLNTEASLATRPAG